MGQRKESYEIEVTGRKTRNLYVSESKFRKYEWQKKKNRLYKILDLIVTDYTVSDRCTLKNLMLIIFNLMYFLNQGVSTSDVKITHYPRLQRSRMYNLSCLYLTEGCDVFQDT